MVEAERCRPKKAARSKSKVVAKRKSKAAEVSEEPGVAKTLKTIDAAHFDAYAQSLAESLSDGNEAISQAVLTFLRQHGRAGTRAGRMYAFLAEQTVKKFRRSLCYGGCGLSRYTCFVNQCGRCAQCFDSRAVEDQPNSDHMSFDCENGIVVIELMVQNKGGGLVIKSTRSIRERGEGAALVAATVVHEASTSQSDVNSEEESQRIDIAAKGEPTVAGQDPSAADAVGKDVPAAVCSAQSGGDSAAKHEASAVGLAPIGHGTADPDGAAVAADPCVEEASTPLIDSDANAPVRVDSVDKIGEDANRLSTWPARNTASVSRDMGSCVRSKSSPTSWAHGIKNGLSRIKQSIYGGGGAGTSIVGRAMRRKCSDASETWNCHGHGARHGGPTRREVEAILRRAHAQQNPGPAPSGLTE